MMDDDVNVGEACNFIGCKVVDFLPFYCGHCDKKYCLDHRSRFTHPCGGCPTVSVNLNLPDISSSSLVEVPTLKEMFEAVERRFDDPDNASKKGASKTHFKISSSTVSSDLFLNERENERLVKLAKVSKESVDNLQRRISMKTQHILMKSKSLGDDTIKFEERKFLIFNFFQKIDDLFSLEPISRDVDVYLFFRKSDTIDDMLFTIGKTFPQLAFNTGSRPHGLSLVLFTADSTDWRVWNRQLKICDTFTDFEVIKIAVVSTNDVVSNQSLIAKQHQAIAQASTQGNTQAKILDPSKLIVYKLDDKVSYRAADGTFEECSIAGVHHDDFPNVYYTIKFDGRERQTDASRLSYSCTSSYSNPNTSKSSNENIISMKEIGTTCISFTLTHGTRRYTISDVGSMTTVGMIKETLKNVIQVMPSKQKMIFKGKTLKDEQKILGGGELGTGIVNNSKVTLVGAPSSSRIMNV